MYKILCTITCFVLLITNIQPFLIAHYVEKHIIHSKSYNHTIFDPHTIIVWIHGTRFIPGKEFKIYLKKVPQIKKAHELITIRYYRKIINALSSNSRFNLECLYFFGWSGKLCNKERKKSALNLYNDLVILKRNYEKKHNISPTIILVGHSHGGNVILHMASYYEKKHNISVDKVILLACPVQECMQYSLKSSFFKKIYSLYSYRDVIQILAPNFLKNEGLLLKNIKVNPFSKRIFPTQSNLIQSRIIHKGYGPRHNDFVKQPFLSLLPNIISLMETWNFKQLERKYIIYIN